MEWCLRHGNQTRRGAHEATNRLRVWLAGRQPCLKTVVHATQSILCYCVVYVLQHTYFSHKPGMSRGATQVPNTSRSALASSTKGRGVPGSIFSSDWLVLRLQRADPHMPDAQCAWLRLISDNLVRPSAYVISKAWTTSLPLTAVSPAFRGLTRKRPHSPDIHSRLHTSCALLLPFLFQRQRSGWHCIVTLSSSTRRPRLLEIHLHMISSPRAADVLHFEFRLQPSSRSLTVQLTVEHPLLDIQRTGHAGTGKWEP